MKNQRIDDHKSERTAQQESELCKRYISTKYAHSEDFLNRWTTPQKNKKNAANAMKMCEYIQFTQGQDMQKSLKNYIKSANSVRDPTKIVKK